MNQLVTIEFLFESNKIEQEYDLGSLGYALVAWDYLKSQKKLTHAVVLQTHRLLMKGKLEGNDLGHYRTVDVMIAGRLGKPPAKIQNEMSYWLERMNYTVEHAEIFSKEELEGEAKRYHVMYEQIHPFVDGNGRTGRMFLNWQRLQLGLPILVIKEAEKYAYYEWFN